jgi:hypothetical protein
MARRSRRQSSTNRFNLAARAVLAVGMSALNAAVIDRAIRRSSGESAPVT